MKRLGIFVFYDAEGIVDDYCEYYIKALHGIVQRLFVVVNGKMNPVGIKRIQKYAQQIVFRDNIGFDAGAYQEVMTSVVSPKELEEIDELIFSNDTCYGPFISFFSIFEQMEKEKVDFWGMNYIDQKILSYLESNFLVFRKKAIPYVLNYFEQYMNLGSAQLPDVYIQFEIGLYQYLKQSGLKHAAYTQFNNLNIYRSPNFCIKKYGYPLMKKKCFQANFFHPGNCMDALTYVKEHMEYDVDMIYDHLNRVHGNVFEKKAFALEEISVLVPDRSWKEIETFCRKEEALYIYGAGVWARKIYSQFYSSMRNFRGFIVTDKSGCKSKVYGYPVWEISEIEKKDKYVIVAMNPGAIKEIKENLGEGGNILYLWDV